MAVLVKIKAFASALPEIRVAEARMEVRLNLINIALIGGCCADNHQNAISVCLTVSVPLHRRLSRLQVASLTRSGDAFAETPLELRARSRVGAVPTVTRVVLYCAAQASSAVAESCATLRALPLINRVLARHPRLHFCSRLTWSHVVPPS